MADVGVVGVESERDGEAPRAFIVKREGIHLTEQVYVLCYVSTFSYKCRFKKCRRFAVWNYALKYNYICPKCSYVVSTEDRPDPYRDIGRRYNKKNPDPEPTARFPTNRICLYGNKLKFYFYPSTIFGIEDFCSIEKTSLRSKSRIRFLSTSIANVDYGLCRSWQA